MLAVGRLICMHKVMSLHVRILMAFFTTKTLVVLEDNPLMEYNSIIKKVMQQEWNITEYDFISNKEFEEKRMDPQYSFIYMSQVTFEDDKTDASYRFLHLSLGGDYFRLNEMPDIASVPLAYYQCGRRKVCL